MTLHYAALLMLSLMLGEAVGKADPDRLSYVTSRFDCGSVSLKLASCLLGHGLSIDQAVKLVNPDPTGISSVLDLQLAAEGLGFKAYGLRMSQAGLERIPSIAIAQLASHTDQPHFVVVVDVVVDVQNNQILMIDGVRSSWVPIERFIKHWTGRVLVISNEELRVGAPAGYSRAPRGEAPPDSPHPKNTQVSDTGRVLYGLKVVNNPSVVKNHGSMYLLKIVLDITIFNRYYIIRINRRNR